MFQRRGSIQCNDAELLQAGAQDRAGFHGIEHAIDVPAGTSYFSDTGGVSEPRASVPALFA